MLTVNVVPATPVTSNKNPFLPDGNACVLIPLPELHSNCSSLTSTTSPFLTEKFGATKVVAPESLS